MAYRILCLICVLLCFSDVIEGQDLLIPKLINFDQSQYNGQNQNWAITQDSNGIIYIANGDGLLEYDGINWEITPLPKQLIPRSLSFDQKGHLYCGTYGQIGQWEKKNNNERTFQTIHDTSWSQVLNNEEIWHILSHPSGTYFQSFSVLLKYQTDG